MIVKRLGQYITEKDISYYLFENSIKASRGSISKAVKNNKSIGSNVIENILTVYADLNPVWLVTGKGEMLLSGKNYGEIEYNPPVKVSLDGFDKIEIIDYVYDNVTEFKSHKSFQKLTKLLFADKEMGEVRKEIEQLKEQVSKLAEESN
ncbi:hypothetical protein [Aquimarina macrocephali]|uniref:hypothetical protein n=1 Tax=Aquimarina macrocephali TaxID=666563 RepID=UPI000463FE52|nr:hypothetical protein [Aquimarina macrocephali]